MIYNLLESFVDNVFRDKVTPKIGSIVYCDLAFGNAEHSGIYVGNNRIIHLDGDGTIRKVTPSQFLNRLDGWNSAMSIYVSCSDTLAVGSKRAAERAKKMIGEKRDYNVIIDNCHQFTAGCLNVSDHFKTSLTPEFFI